MINLVLLDTDLLVTPHETLTNVKPSSIEMLMIFFVEICNALCSLFCNCAPKLFFLL